MKKDKPEKLLPREKLIQLGTDALTDEELLAVLLRSGSKNYSVRELAQLMLDDSGGLEYLADYSYEELCMYDGIKESKATILLAAMELAKRVYYRKNREKISIKEPESVYRTYAPLFGNTMQEEFWILLLDTKHRVFGERKISVGTLNSSLVHPREVFLWAIRRSAKAIFLMHNHPSGEVDPSREDLLLTKRLFQAGEILGIQVLDHIILSPEGYFSFRENHLI